MAKAATVTGVDETLLDRIRATTSSGDARPVRAKAAADAIHTETGARWVGIYTVSDRMVSNEAWSGPAAPAHPTFSVNQGLTRHALATRAVAVSNDVEHDPRYLTNQQDSGSELIVPIVVSGRVVGTLDIEDHEVGAFDGAAIARYEALARVLRALWADQSHQDQTLSSP